MRCGLVRVGILVACAAGPLVAQQPRRAAPAPAANTRGNVSGVVYDSLAQGPLEGARVWIAGTTLGAITDGGGRFRIDSVAAGPQVIAFEHAELDSVGLSNNARRIEVVAGRSTTVLLGVPSMATMRRRLCGSGTMGGRDTGVVFGSLMDVGSGNRLARGRVIARWTTANRNPDGEIVVDRPTLSTLSDSIGNYYLCGLPTQYVFTVVGQAGPFESGITELLLEQRAVARRDIGVSRDSAADRADSNGLRLGRATILGRVADERGQPRPSARAAVDDAASGESFTNETGQFILNNLPAGSQTLFVRMVGYTAVRMPVLLRNNDTLRVAVQMRALTILDTIRITARSQSSENRLNDLDARMRAGFGYFLTSEEVKRRHEMRSVLQGLPQLFVESPGGSPSNYRLHTLVRGAPCPVTIWLDGMRSTTDMIRSIQPAEIVAVEWYPRASGVPPQYSSINNSDCAILLIWTRFM